MLGGEQRLLLCSASSSSSSSLQNPANPNQLQPHQQGQRQQSSALHGILAAEPEIKLAFHGTGNQLSIHVIEARNLRSQSAQKCNSFVRVGFSPETSGSRGSAAANCNKLQTGPAPNTDFPLFDRHFTVELPPSSGDSAGRGRCLMVSVWNQLHSGGFSEFLGCVTFPLDSLIGVHKPSIWYRLVNEMTASSCATSSTSASNYDAATAAATPLPTVSPPGGGFELREALIRRVPDRGLGFTVAGSAPSHVSKVERRSPADAAGVRAGDYILRVDGRRVADTDNETVVRLLRNTGGAASVRLLLGRCRSGAGGGGGGGDGGCQQQLMSTSVSSASAVVAKSPSLPLSYCQRLMEQQQQPHNQSQQKQVQAQHSAASISGVPASLKRDIRSLYEISGKNSGSVTGCAQLPAGYQMKFTYKDQLILRPSEMLMHSGQLNLADVKTGAINTLIGLFLFPDLLLLVKSGGTQSKTDWDKQEVFIFELLREPIHIHQITQCFVLKGSSDLSLKYIGPDGRSHQHLRLRCQQPGQRDCQIWCRRIQDRLLQTVVL